MGVVTMQLLLVLAVGLLGLVASQDTYKCPDGWMLEEDRTGCRCFLIGPDEAVTRSTADLICAGHSGSWVAELDHPGINYWLKSRLLEAIPVGERAEFWLGGRPNNYDHQQMCLTLREYHDPFFPIARDYFWNDEACDRPAPYICERRCAAL